MLLTEFSSLCVGDDWTKAFAAATESIEAAGGGALRVPAGVYRTGPIRLTSNMKLTVEAGAEIRFFDDEDAFEPIELEFEGKASLCHTPCVYAEDAEFVTLSGEGTINGCGLKWWQRKWQNMLKYNRPYLVCFNRCKHVTVSGLTLTNSPVWTVHPLRCEHVTLRDLTIINPWDSPNTDGIDPDASKDVTINNCYIDVGDDCIAIKSGTENTPSLMPCERIIISDCHFIHGHGGVVLGSEMSGGVHDVLVTNCAFYHTDRGIRLKTRRGRGGSVSGLRASNLSMDGVMCAFVFNMYYFCGEDGKTPYVADKNALPFDKRTPSLSDVSITGVSVKNCTACAGYFYGLPESWIENVTISDVSVSFTDGKSDTPAMMADCPKMQRRGFYMRNTGNVSIGRVRFTGLIGEEFDTDKKNQI